MPGRTAPELVASCRSPRTSRRIATTPARRAWFRELREVEGAVAGVRIAEQAAGGGEGTGESARPRSSANAVLKRRDYSWVLYPEETLRPFLQRFL